jgi:cell wall-associated NlpC family hydrolase
MRALALLAAGSLAALPSPLSGQGLTVRMGRLFDDGGWTAYNLAWNHPLPGPLDAQLGGTFLRGPAASERLFGAALDASLFRGGRAGVYVVGGMGAGIGTGTAESWWRSWSAGLGYELVPTPFISLGIETRYREMQPRRRSGAEVALRLSTTFGSTPRAPVPLATERAAAGERGETDAAAPDGRMRAPAGADGVRLSTAGTLASGAKPPAELASDVIEIAEGEIGRRYRLGGTGDPGDGFDCSGLIQFAYQRIGISLPRRSVDQAKAGREIGRDESELLPGDVLTFSGSGGRVTHVGLYIGDGRFIHSASKGVQISRLGEDDPNGRYWYRRWVGARRIIADE